METSSEEAFDVLEPQVSSPKSRIRPVILIAGFLILALAGVGIYAMGNTKADAPLSPSPSSASPNQSPTMEATLEETPALEETGAPEETPSEESLIEGDQGFTSYVSSGEINILLLGSDSRTTGGNVHAWSAGDARSDSIMLLQVSADRQHMTLMSVPRNMAARIPGYGDKTLVNIAYERGGVPLSIQTIQEMTGVRIDYWVLTDFQAFMRLVDAVGGIQLESVQEGSRWYNGTQALAWVRQRKALPNGDIDRVRRHQAFLRALHAKMMTPDALASVGGIQGLYSLLSPYLATNMDASTALNLASAIANINADNIAYVTMPYADTVQDSHGYYMLSPKWSQAAPVVVAFKQGSAWNYVSSHSLETLDSRPLQ